MDDGDRGFADFVSAEQGALLRLAVLLSGDRGHAEDLVQTALLKTYRHWDRISRSGPPSAYVRRVLVTTHASWRRRLSTTEQVVESVPDRPAAPHQDGDEELWPRCASCRSGCGRRWCCATSRTSPSSRPPT